jgi:hypothetical protein
MMGGRRQERMRDGYQKLLKDIQESKLQVFKIRGGTKSIFEDGVVREAMQSSTTKAPILTDEKIKSKFQSLLTVSPIECRFQKSIRTTQNPASQTANTLEDCQTPMNNQTMTSPSPMKERRLLSAGAIEPPEDKNSIMPNVPDVAKRMV